MKILILTACTSKKRCRPVLTWKDFEQGDRHLKARMATEQTLPAGEMYSGEHFVRLMKGIKLAREAGIIIDLWILSAGYGLIPETQRITGYDATFVGLSSAELQSRAVRLQLPCRVPELLNRPGYDLKMAVCGGTYLRTFSFRNIHCQEALIVFGGKELSSLVAPPSVSKVILQTKDCTTYHSGRIGLAGAVAASILTRLIDPDKRNLSTLSKVLFNTQRIGPHQHTLF